MLMWQTPRSKTKPDDLKVKRSGLEVRLCFHIVFLRNIKIPIIISWGKTIQIQCPLLPTPPLPLHRDCKLFLVSQ